MTRFFNALCLSSSLVLVATAHAQTFDHRGITIRGDEYRLRIDGRLHLDQVWVEDDLTVFQDEFQVRRGRLTASLKIGDRIRMKVDRELASRNPGWRNLWASYDVTDDVRVTVGNYSAPLLGENLKSSNDIKLTERSLSSSLAPNFLTGGGVAWSTRHWSLSGGVFGNPLSFDVDNPRDDGRSLIGRAVFAPVKKKREVVHLAAGIERRTLDDLAISRERAIPEFGLDFTRFVDTGNLDGVEGFTTGIAEAGYARGPFMVHGQYLHRQVDAPGLADPVFSGWSIESAFVLTGERQRYSVRSGAFTGIRPDRDGFGAVELAARVGAIDLTDGLVDGGEQLNASVGLNWYVSRNVRFMINGVHADVARNRRGQEETANAVTIRAQLAF